MPIQVLLKFYEGRKNGNNIDAVDPAYSNSEGHDPAFYGSKKRATLRHIQDAGFEYRAVGLALKNATSWPRQADAYLVTVADESELGRLQAVLNELVPQPAAEQEQPQIRFGAQPRVRESQEPSLCAANRAIRFEEGEYEIPKVRFEIDKVDKQPDMLLQLVTAANTERSRWR